MPRLRYDGRMSRKLVLTLVCCAVALSAAAAEPKPQAGREATIHLRDRSTLKCTVIAFADGRFRVLTNGKEDSIPIERVAKVEFGRAVGESVRDPFVVMTPRPTTEPAAVDGAARARLAAKLIGSLNVRQIVHWLARWTDRYRDPKLLENAEAGARRMLATKPGKGSLDRNLRFIVVLARIASEDSKRAARLLERLKRDYPDDPEMQGARLRGLSFTIERIKRSRGRPLRPGMRRPPRDRDREPPPREREPPPE